MIVTGTETLRSYQDLADVLKDGLTPAAQEKILELRHVLLSVQEENFKLRERIRQLESAAAAASQLIYEKGVYWTLEGTTRQGPFCPACQDKNGKLVRLHYSHTGTPGVYWLCKSCHTSW